MKQNLPVNLVEKVNMAFRENEIYTDEQTIKHMEKFDAIITPKNIELYVTYLGKRQIFAFISDDKVVKVGTHDLY